MAKKMTKAVVDKLAGSLVEDLNSKFKGNPHTAAYFLSDPMAATSVKDWVSTGNTTLDLAISNRPNGGYPVGKIVEITGLEASGKSLLAAYALKNTQKKDGLAIYIDTESAVSREYLEAIGIDSDKMLYVPLETLEDIFATIETVIAKVRSSDKDRLVTIVVDSVMGATTKAELEAEYKKDGWATDKALILSKAMRKLTNIIGRERILLIFTNQLRQRLGVTFGDPYTTSGGKALAFHSSVRLRLKSLGQIKTKLSGVDTVVGIKTRCIVQKNRLGPPLKSVNYDIYFDSGIDDYGSILATLKDYKLVKTSGAWYTLEFPESMDIVNPNTGEIKANQTEVKFLSKDFGQFMEANENLWEHVYNLMCDNLIMDYKVNEDFGIDDIEIDSEMIPEDG